MRGCEESYITRFILLVFQYLAKTGGATTLRTVDPSYQDIIGTVRKLSFRDIKIVNLLYSCSGE